GPSPEEVAKAEREKALQLAYEKQVKEWRLQRLQRLTKADGWLSLMGMHWLEVGETRVGSGPANGTRLAAGPDHIGIVTLTREGVVRFVPEPDAGILIDGQP